MVRFVWCSIHANICSIRSKDSETCCKLVLLFQISTKWSNIRIDSNLYRQKPFMMFFCEKTRTIVIFDTYIYLFLAKQHVYQMCFCSHLSLIYNLFRDFYILQFACFNQKNIFPMFLSISWISILLVHICFAKTRP